MTYLAWLLIYIYIYIYKRLPIYTSFSVLYTKKEKKKKKRGNYYMISEHSKLVLPLIFMIDSSINSIS